MSRQIETTQSWQGKVFQVKVLYTAAGVAQQIWIESEKGAVLVDTGDGTLRDILQQNMNLDKLKGILITHGHFDHMGGLHSLLGFLRMIGHEGTLHIYAPDGCQQVFSMIGGFIEAYADTIPFEIASHELQPYETIDLVNMTIEAYPVVHCGSIKHGGIMPPLPAMGYRITCNNERIAVTGDTGDCPSVRELVKDADLAIIEATFNGLEEYQPDMLKKVHLSEQLANEIGRTAREYILVHRVLPH
jgi:ribonuclease Z